jgi:hypothetical protein
LPDASVLGAAVGEGAGVLLLEGWVPTDRTALATRSELEADDRREVHWRMEDRMLGELQLEGESVGGGQPSMAGKSGRPGSSIGRARVVVLPFERTAMGHIDLPASQPACLPSPGVRICRPHQLSTVLRG